jgi:hypothetical protein
LGEGEAPSRRPAAGQKLVLALIDAVVADHDVHRSAVATPRLSLYLVEALEQGAREQRGHRC